MPLHGRHHHQKQLFSLTELFWRSLYHVQTVQVQTQSQHYFKAILHPKYSVQGDHFTTTSRDSLSAGPPEQ